MNWNRSSDNLQSGDKFRSFQVKTPARNQVLVKGPRVKSRKQRWVSAFETVGTQALALLYVAIGVVVGWFSCVVFYQIY